MRKWLLIIAAVLVTVGVLPIAMGIMARSSMEHLVTSLSKQMPFKLAITHYNIGWMTSTAEISIAPRGHHIEEQWQQLIAKENDTGKVSPRWSIKASIEHGPFLLWQDAAQGQRRWRLGRAYVYGQIMYEPETAKLLTHWLGKTPLINTSILIKLIGGYDIHVANQGITYDNPTAKMKINWGGYAAHVITNRQFDKWDVAMRINPADANTPDFTLKSDAIYLAEKMTLTAEDLWQEGKAEIGMPALTFSTAKQKLTINALNATIENHIEAGQGAGFAKLEMKQLQVDNKTYGPIRFELGAKNMDEVLLARLDKTLSTLDDNFSLTLQERQLKALATLPDILAIFAKGAEFDLSNAEITLPEGVVKLSGMLGMNKVSDDVNISMLTALKLFTEQGKATLHIQIPAVLLEKHFAVATAVTATSGVKTTSTNEKLQKLLRAGMLTKTGDTYQISVSFARGQFQVNGKPVAAGFPLPW